MRKTFITIISLLMAGSAFAQNVPSLIIDVDPETMAVGRTVQTVSERALAEDSMYILADGALWAPEGADNLALRFDASYRIREKFVVQLKYQTFRDRIPSFGMTETGAPTKEFTPSESYIGLGLAYRMKNLSFGVDARYFTSSVLSSSGGGATGTSVMANVSAAYSLDKLNLGLAVCNIGTPYKYEAVSYKLPMFAKFNASYEVVKSLGLHAEAGYLIDGGLTAGVGVEYSLMDIVSIRGGYHYGDKAIPSYASVGLGLRFAGIRLDAAYLLAGADSPMKNTLAVGLGYSF